MPNITIHLDDETHRKAKIYAAEHGRSVSDLFREHIKALTRDRGDQGVLARYSRSELPAHDAMDALGLTCVEELYLATRSAGLELPHANKATAGRHAAAVAKLVARARRHA